MWLTLVTFPDEGKHYDCSGMTLSKKSSKKFVATQIEELEARVLFSADSFSVAVPFAADAANIDVYSIESPSVLSLVQQSHQSTDAGPYHQTDSDHPGSPPDTVLQTKELVVIDSRVQEIDLLLDLIPVKPDVGFEFLLLDSNRDGMVQISDRIAALDPGSLTAVHIVSHGSDGLIELGNKTIGVSNIDEYTDTLQSWRSVLADDADLLLYGCDLAASVDGQSLIEQLAVLCDCDIAASENTTGHQTFSGDWQLEYHSGDVQTSVVFPTGVFDWPHTLDITSDLIGHWTFNDGTASDSSITGNGGVVFSPVVFDPSGVDGGSVTFTPDAMNSNGYVEVPGSTAYDFGTGDFTVSFWYKSSTDASSDQFLVGDSSGALEFTANNSNDVSLLVDATILLDAPGGFVADDAWHHVAGVREGSQFSLYVDGVVTDQETNAGVSVNTGDFKFGAFTIQSLDYEGSIDEVRFYDRGLNLSEVGDLYNLQSNAPPQLTSFNNTLTSTVTNTEATILIGNFLAAGDESDVDGTVDSFRVKSVASGSLRIGNSIATATPFVAGSNDLIELGVGAFWTPDAQGVRDAFTVVAVDDDGAESVTPVMTTVDVANQPPTLSAFSSPIKIALEDSIVELTMADLLADGDEADADGYISAFKVNGVSSGTLRIGTGGNNAIPYQPAVNDVITATLNAYWTPDANANGVLTAMDLVAVDDDGDFSSPVVPVSMEIVSVADAPVSVNRVIEVTDDTNYVFNTTDFPHTDADNDAFASLGISGLPGAGALELNGLPVALNDNIAVSDIAAGRFVYVPAAGASGLAYDNFEFRFRDSGTTGNNLAAPRTVTVDVVDGIVDITSGIEINIGDSNNAYLIANNPIGVAAQKLTFETTFSAQPVPDDVTFISYALPGQHNELLAYIPPGASELRILINGGTQVSSAIDYRTALVDGAIHSLAITFDSDEGGWAVYVDGSKVDHGTGFRTGATIDMQTGAVVFGQEQDGVASGFDPAQGFSGVFYDIRLWDRVLGESEINSYHQHKIDPAHPPDNLIANWQMSEINTSSEIVDSVSGNNLSVQYINNGAFVPGTAVHDLNIDENSTAATHVGYVRPIDEYDRVNLVKTSQFIAPGYETGINLASAGATVGDWSVVSGTVDVDAGSTFDRSPGNGNVVDLSGTQAGAIAQTLNTMPGVEYELTFALSGNGAGGDPVKQLDVSADNKTQRFEYEIGALWNTNRLLWDTQGFRFIATSATTELRFESLENNIYGPLLADVQVRTIPRGINSILADNPGITYDHVSGRFYKDVQTLMTWTDADASASATLLNGVPGRLVSLDSRYVHEYVTDLASTVSAFYWTGGTDADKEGEWKWSNGKEFWNGGINGSPVDGAFTRWNSAEPNSSGDEDYLELRSFGKWNDESESRKLYYVVEWDVAEVLGQYQYTLIGDASSRFDIDDTTGEITVENGMLLDHETDQFHDIVVEVSDPIGNKFQKTMRVVVNNVNEAPSGSNIIVPLLEEAVHAFSISDFLFSDIEPDNFSGILITTVPSNGALTQTGSNVTSGQFIPYSQLGTLAYQSAGNYFGTDQFDFQVVDDGGTDRGGIDTDPTSNTVTFNISGVNDAPSGGDNVFNLLETQTHIFDRADFGFSDTLDGDLLSEVVITSINGGVITRGGTTVAPSDVITAADIDNNAVIFTPSLFSGGTATATVFFAVRDDGGTASGGVDTDQSPNQITFNLSNVNNAPSGTDKTRVVNEDAVVVINGTDFGYSDPLDGNPVLSVIIDTPTFNGSLELNGYDVQPGQSVLFSDIATGRLVYRPDADQFGVSYDSLEFRVRDNGGIANGGIDTDPVANTLTFDVNPVNDPPTKNQLNIHRDEDAAYLFSMSAFNFSDTEGDDLLEVIIESLPSDGILEFGGAPVTVGQVIPAASVGLLLYTPDLNGNGAPYSSFDIRLRDDGGTANGGADLSVLTSTIGFHLKPVNDPPTGSDFSVSLPEDGIHTFSASDFTVNDVESDLLASIVITTLPSGGSLTVGGAPVAVGQSVLAADIGSMVYTPATDANGLPLTSFKFRVQDDGGVANGGVDLGTSEQTVTINVLPVNDPPSGIDFTVNTNEDTAYTFSASEFGLTDVESHTLDRIIISTLPQNGVLTNAGSQVSVGDTIFASAIANLSYTPAPNINGIGVDDFTFRVADAGGIVNSGIDTDTTPNRVDINVTAVNDAPVGTDVTLVVDEDSIHQFVPADFGFIDSDGDQLLSVTIDTLPANGQLILAGVPVMAGDTIPTGSIAALSYTPLPDASGLSYDNFKFVVRDDGGTLNGGNNTALSASTITFDVTPINDAPVGQNGLVTTAEDTAYTFNVSDFPFTDTENDSLATLKITKLPVAGQLNVGGVPVFIGQEILQADIPQLSYAPPADVNGSAVGDFSFQIRDNGGASNGGVDLDPVWRAMIINVLSVNDAPLGKDKIINVIEDTSYQFSVADFGFSDLEGNSLQSVVIDTLPFNGALEFAGTPVVAGQIINATSIGSLKFVPEPDENRSGYDTFSFSVVDDGGTLNGGLDKDPLSNNINIDLVSVNDPPEGTDKTVATLEDVPYVFSHSDFGFTDSDGNDFLSVVIDTLPAAGQLGFSGQTVSAGDEIPVSLITDLEYTPPVNQSGSPFTVFSFSVRDDGGAGGASIDKDTTPNLISIDVADVNDAPLGKDKIITVLEDTPFVFQGTDFGFTDPYDNDGFAGIEITDLPVNGALELSGAQVSAGQFIHVALISGLEFVPEPGVSTTGYDSFGFVVIDDGGVANGGVDTDQIPNRINVNVASVNDAPMGTDRVIITDENTAYVFSNADFGFSDSDGHVLQSVLIDSVPVNGQLLLAGVPVSVNQSIGILSVNSLSYLPPAGVNGTAIDTIDFRVRDDGGVQNGGQDTDQLPNTLTVNINLANDEPSGTDTVIVSSEDSDYVFSESDFGFTDTDGNSLQSVIISTLPASGQLLLSGVPVMSTLEIARSQIPDLVFVPEANVNGAGYDNFSFQVRDDGGILSGGVDTDTTPNTITIDLNSVNDAPAGMDKVITVAEDNNYTFGVSDFGISDLENDNLLNVIISELPVNGQLELAGVPVLAGQSVSATALGSLVFIPEPNANRSGYDSFEFQIQDDGGTTIGGSDTDPVANKINIDVLSVNDSPDAQSNTVTLLEDTTHVFNASEFGFSDTDTNNLSAIIIDSVPSAGQLLIDGVPVVAGQNIGVSDISDLEFIPAPDANGTGYAAFDFRVKDDGGVANSGSDTSQIPRTITIDVTSVNDAPSGEDKLIVATEDTPYTLNALDFGFSDPDGGNLQSVSITSLPSNGELRLSGATVVAGQVLSAAQIGDLAFVPEPDEHSISYDSFGFTVTDDGGVVPSGSDTDPSPNTISISLLAVNDPPVGMDSRVFTPEDTDYLFTVADFIFTDTEADDLQAVVIQTLPLNGVLLYANVPVSAGQVIPAAQIGSLKFVPLPDTSQIAYDSFKFQVQDNGGNANGGIDADLTARTMTIDVGLVNDPPGGMDVNAITLEDTPYVFDVADFGFTDSDNNQFKSVIVDSLPSSGNLMFAGSPINVGQSIDAALLGDLAYVPDVNIHGVMADSFRHRVVDDGGVSGLGQDTSIEDNTWTIDIVSVNDAPGASDATLTTREDTPYVFDVADFGFTDADSNSFAALLVASLPATGQLLLAGAPVVPGQSIASADIPDLAYVPVANSSGVESFKFTVQDNGGVTNGGVDTSAPDNQITLNIQGINDAPELLLTDVEFDEGSQNVLDQQMINAFDIDDTEAQLQLTLTDAPSHGELLLNGVPLDQSESFSVEQLNSGALVYLHNGSEASNDSIGFTLQDGGEDGVPSVYGLFNIVIDEVVDPAAELNDDEISIAFGQADVTTLLTGSNSVTDNDTFVSNDNHTLTLETDPQYGVVTLNSDGTFSYTHDGSETLNDSFSYKVTNIDDISSVATVKVFIEPPLGSAFETPNSDAIDAAELTNNVLSESEEEGELEVEQTAEQPAEASSFLEEQTDFDFFQTSSTGKVRDGDSAADTVVVIENESVVGTHTRNTYRNPETAGIELHNRLEEISLSENAATLRASLIVELDVFASDLRDVTDNTFFRDALAGVDRDLKDASDEVATRYNIGSEAVFGVSLSATAGVLVWALRGGALLASMVAATPLWSSIDPVRVMGGKDDESADSPADAVEEVFE